MTALRVREERTSTDERNPPVPLGLMTEALQLYLKVMSRLVDFTRTPEDTHSPLMANIRPLLRSLDPQQVDAALAVQRFLLLRGGDAVRYCNSILNRTALVLGARGVPSLSKFFTAERFHLLLAACARIPISEVRNAGPDIWDLLEQVASTLESVEVAPSGHAGEALTQLCGLVSLGGDTVGDATDRVLH